MLWMLNGMQPAGDRRAERFVVVVGKKEKGRKQLQLLSKSESEVGACSELGCSK